MAEVICPNCNTSFKIGNNGNLVDVTKISGTVELVPETIRNNNKGDNNMDLSSINFKGMTQEEKNEVLKAMGFNPFDFSNTVDKTDPIVQQIYENGYVKNEKLHRRWITAQTMRLLGWYDGIKTEKSWSGNSYTVDYWTKNIKDKYNWTYIFKQLANEYEALENIEGDCPRKQFFNPDNLIYIFSDYVKQVNKYIETFKVKNCKGIPYKIIKGKNVFVEDILSRVIIPMNAYLNRIIEASSYDGYCYAIRQFLKSDTYIKLPNDTPLSQTWIDMFKKSGAYYTMENLVKYSGLKLVKYETDELLDTENSLKYLFQCRANCGYELLALLKKSLEVNNFKFDEAIK